MMRHGSPAFISVPECNERLLSRLRRRRQLLLRLLSLPSRSAVDVCVRYVTLRCICKTRAMCQQRAFRRCSSRMTWKRCDATRREPRESRRRSSSCSSPFLPRASLSLSLSSALCSFSPSQRTLRSRFHRPATCRRDLKNETMSMKLYPFESLSRIDQFPKRNDTRPRRYVLWMGTIISRCLILRPQENEARLRKYIFLKDAVILRHLILNSRESVHCIIKIHISSRCHDDRPAAFDHRISKEWGHDDCKNTFGKCRRSETHLNVSRYVSRGSNTCLGLRSTHSLQHCTVNGCFSSKLNFLPRRTINSLGSLFFREASEGPRL